MGFGKMFSEMRLASEKLNHVQKHGHWMREEIWCSLRLELEAKCFAAEERHSSEKRCTVYIVSCQSGVIPVWAEP